MPSSKPAFWKQKTFDQMTHEQWESLCDGCAKCCLHKLEDEESGDVYYTNIACAYLNTNACTCKDYQHRLQNVSECLKLQPQDVEQFYWLPSTCAYRLLAEGKDLPQWHPLVSGDAESVHKQGVSVRGKTVAESHVKEEDYEEHVINWID